MKNHKPSKKKNRSEKNVVRDKETKRLWMEDYLDCFTFKLQPVTEKFLERLGKELVHWAMNNDDALTLSQFYNAKGMHHDTFESWYKYPKFRMAKDLALSIIGDRREINTLKKKFDSSTNNYMMPTYSKSWKSMAQWRQSLRDDSQGKSNAPVNVYLEQFPSSDMVPEKKTPEEVAARAAKHTRLGHGIDN